jgi:hypothetical protein
VEGGGQADVVGGQGVAQHVQVRALGGVHAHADAGVGDHHVGQALRLDAGLAGGHDAVHIGHVGAVDAHAVRRQALGLRPGLHFGRAARHQGQAPAGLRITRGQRLADAAGGAGDEDQGCGVVAISGPPLTLRMVAVTYAACGDSSHSTPSATSSARPGRCMGISAADLCARCASPLSAWISVSMMPGRTALTRTPSAASSRPRPMVKVSIAPLAAA